MIRDPFHRALAALIDEEIERRKTNLAAGEARRVTEDTVSVAEKYAAATSYIQALWAVLDLCAQVEENQETMGPRPANVKVIER